MSNLLGIVGHALGTIIGALGRFGASLLGHNGGETQDELERSARRESFSKYLPWVAYDDKTRSYLNTDNSIGHIWECTPYSFAGTREIKLLEALLRLKFPHGTVLQFILYPDPYVEPFIQAFEKAKTRPGALIQRNTEEYANYLREGVNGLGQMQGIPTRNFRLFVTLKSTEEIPIEDISVVEENLKGAGLGPVRMPVGDLLEWSRRFFNHHAATNIQAYDDLTPIRQQTIAAETVIEANNGRIIFKGVEGDPEKVFKVARCLTPKTMPDTDFFDTNCLSGGVMGVEEDTEQLTTPYLWTTNIVFDDVKSEIHGKATVILAQKAPGTFMAKLRKRAEEFNWALSKIDGENFVKVLPALWVFGRNDDEARTASARARRIWEGKQYVMQEETFIAKPMFIASLPFGLYASKNNLRTLDRDFYLPISTVAQVLPVQADFRGSSRPVLGYIGRKGQLIGIDVFDPRSNNHNFSVVGGSGAGKSFQMNHLVSNYHATGAKCRVIDLGYSYQKLCRVIDGRFMEFGKELIVINPFDSSAHEEEDRRFDRIATANVLSQMVYSASGKDLTETEWTLIKDAVRFAVERDNGESGVNHVREYLRTFPKHVRGEAYELPIAVERAKEMAFNLGDFCTDGDHGHFFNGKSTFNISSDDFVVLELERLKPQRELFKVISMQVLNNVTQDLYLSDRSEQRFILFDEAAIVFREGGRIADICEEGFRRARKYHGSFGTITQSPLDLPTFGRVGDVIRANAAFKIFLECPDYAEAARRGIISYDGLILTLLQGVRNAKPRYSESFWDTPFGCGVARLSVDQWTYWMNTSAGDENAKIYRLLDDGLDVVSALERLSGRSSRPTDRAVLTSTGRKSKVAEAA